MAASLVSAQSGRAYERCGGIGFTGCTTCDSGYHCEKYNDYYSQCVPKAATPTSTTSTTYAPEPTSAGNPFHGKKMWKGPHYSWEITSKAIPAFEAAGKTALVSAAKKVAEVPTFIWLDTISKVPAVRKYLQQVKELGSEDVIVPFIIYDLPDRDCSSGASNGELSLANGGAERYKNEYIDPIRAILKDYPKIPVAFIVEPDALANLVTNMNVTKCAGAAEAYKALTTYAIQQLSLPNVSLYLDGGHGGWLGWPANLPPAAKLYAEIRKNAGSPPQLRGLATNVSNYNGWSLATCPAYTSPNPNCDEKRYIEAMASALATEGWADTHYIVDQSRSGMQPTGQIKQGHFCNVIDTGFGIRPTSNIGHPSVDAIVWAKPGGESDGTSDKSSKRYDEHCSLPDALQPAPEAGKWFQAYFEQLLKNASPSFM
ncbi:1, 4-beta cellobiohydrolase [Trichophaea hybrida]|nr:1, 4-beta cellobiohydrolase [Trichophaea hybrida]